MILTKRTKLYRYDISIITENHWSDTLKSIEYCNTKYGCKNKIGAYFFYLDTKTRDNVLNGAIKKREYNGIYSTEITKTSCKILEDVKLLDIRDCARPVNLLNTLFDEHIDVVNDDFSRYDVDGKVPFSSISESFHKLRIIEKGTITDYAELIKIGSQIDTFFHNKTNYLGQLLTDFENGFTYKQILLNLGYEGYIFTEEPTSPTVCLFESDKISDPVHEYSVRVKGVQE